MKGEKKSRREFLSQSVKSITALAGGTAMIQFLESCSAENNPVSSNAPKTFTIDIGEAKYSALQSVGGTVALSKNDLNGLPENGVFIVRSTESSATVMSRTCTHQSCQVNAFNGQIAECPCHGSRFNLSGGVVNGPANSPLKRFESSLKGNTLKFTI